MLKVIMYPLETLKTQSTYLASEAQNCFWREKNLFVADQWNEEETDEDQKGFLNKYLHHSPGHHTATAKEGETHYLNKSLC